MSRLFEFGLGATFKQQDQEGNETTRNAIEAVGGKRDGNQAGMLPPVEPVVPGVQDDVYANRRYGDQDQLDAPVTRRAGPLPFPLTEKSHTKREDDYKREKGT